jgi:hypothetical protein
MTDYETRRSSEPVSGWAVGGVLFAGILMIVIGIFEAISGLAAILENGSFFVVSENYAFEVDVTAWGWIHVILGIVVGLAGLYLLFGRTWARVVGITLAILAAVANFFFIPYYPLWSLLIVALSIWVIWSLTRPLERA